MTDAPDSEAPRKGRGNAILTYEAVDGMRTLIVEANVKLNRLILDQDQAEKETDSLELRVRQLETTQAQFIATQTSSRNTAIWAWGAVQTAIMTMLAILTYLNRH